MMAKKLIDQEEAARLLGITVDELNILRDRQEIYGYRDGGNWKYKDDEVNRYLQSRQDETSEDSWFSSSDDLDDVPLELNDEADSVLLNDLDLDLLPEPTSSTIIGAGASGNPADSDIQLARDGAVDGSSSDVQLVEPLEPTLSANDSDVLSATDTGRNAFDDLDLGDSGLALAGSDIDLTGGISFGDDELNLDDELKLDDLSSPPQEIPASDPGSGIALADIDGDDDFILGDSADEIILGDSADDLQLGAGDSGISLVDAADSGLSLEEAPLSLSAVDSGVELVDFDDADVISLDEDDVQLATPASIDSLADDQSEDDFLLTPLDDEGASDASDSGSQVIALDSDDEFPSASNLFDDSSASGAMAPSAMLEDDDFGAPASSDVGFGAGALGGAGLGGGLGSAAAATSAGPAISSGPAVTFSTGSTVFLACCALMLVLCSMMAFDLMRNMWSWDQPYSLNSGIMHGILSLFE